MVQELLLELANEFFVSDESPILQALETLKDGASLRFRAPGGSVALEKRGGVFMVVPERDEPPHIEFYFEDIDDFTAFRGIESSREFGERVIALVNEKRARVDALRPFVELWELGMGPFLEEFGILSAPPGYSELISPLKLREIAFTEILDVKYLQELVDELTRITGVRLWVLDMNSMPVVVSATGGEHCQLIIDSLVGVIRCYNSAIGGLTELKKTMTPRVRTCHAGFICFDAPLILGGEMVGMISGDASLTETPDLETYRRLAGELGIDPGPLIDSLGRVRSVNREEVEFLLSVVNAIARVVTEMSFKQYLLSDLSRDLKLKNYELKALFQAITQIQEREKAAVARDLHDDTGQNLTNALVNLEMALGEDGLTQEVRNHVESAENFISSVLQQLHDLSASLHPPVLDDLGLTEALRNLLRRLNADHPIDFKLITSGEEGALPYEVKINLYRIVQEAISNIIKHSGAGQALVYLNRYGNAIDLLIVDDGRGFEGSPRDDQVVHLGLVNMRERAEQIGGTFKCPPSDRGVTVAVHVPI
jgi:signal transduction histidine kinase